MLENPRTAGAAGVAGGRAPAPARTRKIIEIWPPHPPAPARFFIFDPRARPRPQKFSLLAPAPARARMIFHFWPPRPQKFSHWLAIILVAGACGALRAPATARARKILHFWPPRPPAPARIFTFGPRARPRPQDF